MDYDYRNMTLRAPSEEGSGSVAKAADGKTGTIWHTNWGKGSGSTDLRNDPDNRYLQIELKETEKSMHCVICREAATQTVSLQSTASK